MNFEDEEIQRLVDVGALEFAGVDTETGEPLYRPTSTLKNINPALNEEMSSYFLQTTMKLWEKGFVDMDVTAKDPLVNLSVKAFDIDAINSLGKDERVVIEEIIRVLSEKK